LPRRKEPASQPRRFSLTSVLRIQVRQFGLRIERAGSTLYVRSTNTIRYTDAHGSSVQVPSALVRVQSDPNALSFRSADGNTFATFETITEERPGFPGNDPEGDLTPTSKDCDVLPPSYRVINSRVSAYSCVKAGKVEYWIARYSRSGSVRLHVEYSGNDKNYWDPIVTRMSASMKQQERHEINR
jgi:hypothetical protein